MIITKYGAKKKLMELIDADIMLYRKHKEAERYSRSEEGPEGFAYNAGVCYGLKLAKELLDKI